MRIFRVWVVPGGSQPCQTAGSEVPALLVWTLVRFLCRFCDQLTDSKESLEAWMAATSRLLPLDQRPVASPRGWDAGPVALQHRFYEKGVGLVSHGLSIAEWRFVLR